MRHLASFPRALLPPNPRIRFRAVRPRDAGQLHARCLPEMSLEYCEQLVARAISLHENGRGCGYVVLADDWRIVQGFGQFTTWSGCGEISDLIIKASERGQGLGTALIQFLCQQARKMSVDCVEIGVAMSNPRALALYRRLGFLDDRQIQIRLDGEPEPVIYLRLPLT